ncbi:MAG: tRNA (adenosine(37)-N6)-threonylcarbamoyltransferase complex dimerization subunit type 1 TsaB [Gemmataceae bacterium]
MTQRLLILETSGTVGQVGLSEAGAIVARRQLDETRRHARDLAPTVSALLKQQGWKPRDLAALIVSRGPGSYTGLRVGLMSATAFAYATSCQLVAIDTFTAIARQAPAETELLDVIADAQQDKVYLQRFARQGDALIPASALVIQEMADWLTVLEAGVRVSGPGLRRHHDRLPVGCPRADETEREPQLDSLLELGRQRLAAGQVDDLWQLEPLYLRPSSAEEKWDRLGK